MKTHKTLILSAALALALALFITIRVTLLRRDFDQKVRAALKTSAGYDKDFIRMVNRLEEELATRASFGYQGGKDPMTGRVRQVVQQAAAPSRPHAPSRAAAAPEEKKDPVKLTAIIYDERNKRFTAIVMDGERSLSLEVGDNVHNRQVRKITDKMIVMEDASLYYWYDVFGNSSTERK